MDAILTEPIKDLQPPILLDNTEINSWWLVLIFASFILIGWLVVFLLKKAKLPDPPLPPDQLALVALQGESTQSAGSILKVLKDYLYASLGPLPQVGFTSEEFFQMPESKKLSSQKISDLQALFSQLEPLAFSGQTHQIELVTELRQQVIHFVQTPLTNVPEKATT